MVWYAIESSQFDSTDEAIAKVEAYLSRVENHFQASQAKRSETSRTSKNVPSKLNQIELSFVGDSLIRWNVHQLPDPLPVPSKVKADGLARFRNGIYLIKKIIPHEFSEQSKLLIYPLYIDYGIENRYLSAQIAPGLKVKGDFELSLEKSANSIRIATSEGAVIYLAPKEDQLHEIGGRKQVCVYLVLQIGIWMLMFLIIVRMANLPGARLLFIAGVFLLIPRLLLPELLPLSEVHHIPLFNPSFYASSLFGSSLADLLLNSVAVFLFALVAARLYAGSNGRASSSRFRLVQVVILVLHAYLLVLVIRSLILNSNPGFELDNFILLGPRNFLGFAVIFFVSAACFFHLLQYLNASFERRHLRIENLVFIIASAIGIAIVSRIEPWYFAIVPAVWLYAFMQGLRWLNRRESRYKNLNLTLVSCVFVSLLSAFTLEDVTRERTEQLMTKRSSELLDSSDPYVEYLLGNRSKQLLQDRFISAHFTSSFHNTASLETRLKKLYFGGPLSKFSLKISTRIVEVSSDSSFAHEQALKLSDFAQDTGAAAWLPNRFHPKKWDDRTGYIGYFTYPIKEKRLGLLDLILEYKPGLAQSVYPELLMEESARLDEKTEDFGYALYRDSLITEFKGAFQYPSEIASIRDFIGITEGFSCQKGACHLIEKGTGNELVIVRSMRKDLVQHIAVLSFLFSAFLLSAMLLALLFYATQFKTLNSGWVSSGISDLSFRNKISLTLVSMVVISFVIIGWVTANFFKSDHENYHTERLSRKEASVIAGLNYFEGVIKPLADQRGMSVADLDDLIQSLAQIHSIDINYYDLSGRLVSTSQPDIFNQGVVSSLMAPNALKTLQEEGQMRLMENERIGRLKFLSLYAAVRDNDGKLVAYLNLPYFSKAKDLQKEITSFLVALVNVYALLLIGASLLAIFISNSITNPLTQIAAKLSKIKLGAKNEPIPWEGNDEIGLLVAEYNRMIAELEKSAGQLARQERESAWREMAQQIAHEIKNPLTPMKLSIQHLQRAIADRRPDVADLAERVSQTLVEQIDTLTQIASAFSAFARMPKAQNEAFDLIPLIQSVVDLFNKENQVQCLVNTQLDTAFIYADRGQILRAFNNLVKNAIQAVEGEDQGEVKVVIGRKESKFQIDVIDNGKGVPADLRDKIFVPKFTTKSSGSGFGLAITRQIVQSAGGTIELAEVASGLTCFRTLLPVLNRE